MRSTVDKQGYKRARACTRPRAGGARTCARAHTHISNTCYFSTATVICESASLLRYTHIACLVNNVSKYFWRTWFIRSLFRGRINRFTFRLLHIFCSAVCSFLPSFLRYCSTSHPLLSPVKSSPALHFLASSSRRLLIHVCMYVCIHIYLPHALHNTPFTLLIALPSALPYQIQISAFATWRSVIKQLLHSLPSSMEHKSTRDPSSCRRICVSHFLSCLE